MSNLVMIAKLKNGYEITVIPPPGPQKEKRTTISNFEELIQLLRKGFQEEK